MPEHLTPALAAAYAAEILFFFAGLVVWWRFALRPEARRQSARLEPWAISPSEFLACAVLVIGGGYLFLLLVHTLVEPHLRGLPANDDTRTIVYNVVFQAGLFLGLAGAAGFAANRDTPAAAPGALSVPLAGILTFLAVRPASDLGGIVSEQFLRFFGLPATPQEQIEIFTRLRSPALFAAFFTLAVVIAPVVEELIFRAGLFRYLRTRLPRLAALLLPSLFFALLHMDWKTLGGLASLLPLTLLAVVFSLAYERTGRIGVTMIAHGLFNLNNILFLLAGMRS
ncbi:MAG TPA: CPBP family intramembrane glutamic endopeptidase [Opitutaceae bacterium]|nr:CPBP family intramembrane glutamic endopeptidase [Opitutaceae bacterium]